MENLEECLQLFLLQFEENYEGVERQDIPRADLFIYEEILKLIEFLRK